MAENTAIAIIEKQTWLEPAADRLQRTVSDVFAAGGDTGQKFKNFLHGTWLGHPLHAAITDIPVGAWTSALVMDSIEDLTGRPEFGRGADAAVAIGLVGAVASAAAGLTDWSATDGRARTIGLAHGLLNITGTLLYTGSYIARKSGARSTGRGLSNLGWLIAFGSAWLGGKLVYGEQIGVDHTVGQSFPSEFTPVLADDLLGEGQVRRAHAAGSRILVARCNGTVYAISEVCSHLGGPLAEGELQARDCTITCPWHGSTFSLEDGSVVNGPATHPAPCLDARVHDGQIEVKLRATR